MYMHVLCIACYSTLAVPGLYLMLHVLYSQFEWTGSKSMFSSQNVIVSQNGARVHSMTAS